MPKDNSNVFGHPITGTDGDDTLAPVDPGEAVRINGGDGNDDITGSDQGDVINAGDGDDTIEGGGGDDTIRGNDGNDTAVYAGSIFDFLIYGGKGNATVVEDTSPDAGDEGTDTVKQIGTLLFGDFTYLIGQNNAPLVLMDDQTTDEDSVKVFTFDAFDFDGGTVSLDDISVSDGTVSAGGPVDVTNGNYTGGQFTVTFDPGAAFQYLAVGESATETVSVEVSDGQGGVSVLIRDIVIAGLNDGVVIDAGASDLTGAVTEDDSTPILTTSGSILFSDVDLSDTHVADAGLAGIDGLNDGLTGAAAEDFLTVAASDTTGVANGTADWSFSAENALFQYLGSGDSVTFSYDVNIDDGNGGAASEMIGITIFGVNDDPEIIGGDFTGEVTEDTLLTVSGTILAEDVDYGPDIFNWSVQGGGAGAYGSMSVDLFGTWTYTLDNVNADVQALELDETLTDTFIFVVDDGLGGEATQAVTITINGLADGEDVINPLLQTFEAGVSGGPGGFVFQGDWGTVDATLSDGRSGNPYDAALQSGMFVANNGAADVSIVRDTNFDLQSAYFTSPFAASMTLQVHGYDDGVLIGSQTINLTRDTTSFVEFDDATFDSVDEVVFEAGGAFFGMDNLLIIG
ncbi:VCBS domain-containing protein [Antarctobacter sp.]|uniref:VCBS domain-containing protein n=1 Tax=Antarctobacter sp. TaxID=1872577 RepID=UPI003A90E019